MIHSSIGLVRIADFYYDEPPRGIAADIVRYNHWTDLPPGDAVEAYTIVLDLAASLDRLTAAMQKSLRYDLRRSEEDGFVVRHWPAIDDAPLHSFSRFYDEFARRKGLPAISRRRLRVLTNSHHLALSCASKDGAPLVWHAYLALAGRFRLLHSAAVYEHPSIPGDRQLIGRANRRLHWEDIRIFQESGASILDLGGWYAGQDDSDRLRINAFKQQFGGKIIRQFNSAEAVTRLGRVALWARSRG